MRPLSVLWLLVLVLCTGCASLGLYPRSMEFTRDAIEKKLAERMPMRRTYLGIIDLELSNPRVAMLTERARVATTFDAVLRIPFLPKPLTGTSTLSGVPRYDASSRSVVLGAAALDAIAIEGVPERLAGQLRALADTLAQEALADRPLHTLKPDDLRFAGTELEPGPVRITGDRLVVELRPR